MNKCQSLLLPLTVLLFSCSLTTFVCCQELPVTRTALAKYDKNVVGHLEITLTGGLDVSVDGQESTFRGKNNVLVGFDAFCLATLKFRHFESSLDSWDLHDCTRILPKGKDTSDVVTSVPVQSEQTALHLIALKHDASRDRPRNVAFWAALPLVLPNMEPATRVRMFATQGPDSWMSVSLRLGCHRNRFGSHCSVVCLPPTERHVCDHVTGKLRCAKGLRGPECQDKVFLSRVEASQFLRRRPKRANSWHRFEEASPGNIERECEEETCSKEEAREAFEDDALTKQYWIRYTDPNQCQPNPCVVSHTIRCEDKLADYKCHCKSGYEGKNCQQEINACSSNPCLNGATCRKVFPASFSCGCVPGYRGRLCDVNIDECLTANCGMHGTCVDKINDYSCSCDLGYTGSLCSIDIDECQPNPCENDGNCTDHVGYHVCSCDDDYYGEQCEIRKSPCRSGPCMNNGACTVNPDFSFGCSCTPGYTGSICEHEVGSPCIEPPCRNGGKCYVIKNNVTDLVPRNSAQVEGNTTFDFRCACDVGFGGKRCDIEIPACEYSRDQCPSNATCVSLRRQFVCVCPDGFTGDNCNVPGNDSDVTERYRCETDPCLNGARCLSQGNHTVCLCREGYNGTHCENEINYCASSPCINGAECLRIPGRFHCNCAEGFNGTFCENDIDECSDKPDLCRNNATCNNTIGSFLCLCDAYHIGRFCEVEIYPCESSPCQHGATCRHGPDSYLCDCIEGYGGHNCQDIIKPCEEMTNPCQNNAMCTPLPDQPPQASCTCQPGFFGRLCEKEIDHCVVPGNTTHFDSQTQQMVRDLVPRIDCGENGNCVSERLRFRCDCDFGYEGTLCEREFVPPVVNCTSEYCKCPMKLLHKLKADHNLTTLECQYRHYDKGVCSPPTCLSPPCQKATSNYYCSWKSKCLERAALGVQKDLNDCPVLEIGLDRSELSTGATVESVCDKVRVIPTMSKRRESVEVHCELRKSDKNVTLAVAFDSVTSEVSAFLLAVDVFQRFEQEIGNKNGDITVLTDEIDPFFSEALVFVRFGSHVGHYQRHIAEQSASSASAGQSGTGLIFIVIPIALFLLALLLIIFFIVQRRRRKKTLHINYVVDSDYVGDVIATPETASVDRIVVSPTGAHWSKILRKKKKKSKVDQSFDNPLFAGGDALARRPSVHSNDYGTTGSPTFNKSAVTSADLKSVETATVDYCLERSPSHSGASAQKYSESETLPHGVVQIVPTNAKHAEKEPIENPYAQAETPYTVAGDASAKLDQDPYTFADDAAKSGGSPSGEEESSPHAYESVTKLRLPPTDSSGHKDQSSSSLSSGCGELPREATSNDDSAIGSADTSGEESADVARVTTEEQYQSPKSTVAFQDDVTDKQTTLPEIYSVPRKANPVD